MLAAACALAAAVAALLAAATRPDDVAAVGMFHTGGVVTEEVDEAQRQQAFAKLKKIKGPMLLVGDGSIAYGENIQKALGKRAAMAPGTALLPQAANLAALAWAKFKRGGDDLISLVPNYIRCSDAEIGFLGKKGSQRLSS